MSLDFAFSVGQILPTGGSGQLLSNQWRHEGWACYPEAAATVITASVCPIDHINCVHIACLIYAYQVKKNQFSGLYARSFPTREDALRFVEDCMDLSVVAKYHPKSPQESCPYIAHSAMLESEAARIVFSLSARAS